MPIPLNTEKRQKLFAKSRLNGKSEKQAYEIVIEAELRDLVKSVPWAENKDLRLNHYTADLRVGPNWGPLVKTFQSLDNGDYDWIAIKMALEAYVNSVKDSRQKLKAYRENRAKIYKDLGVKKLSKAKICISYKTSSVPDKFLTTIRWTHLTKEQIKALHAILKEA